MAGNILNDTNHLQVIDRHKSRLIDLNNLQVMYDLKVASETVKQKEEFHALSLAERQELLQKLINRVKSL